MISTSVFASFMLLAFMAIAAAWAIVIQRWFAGRRLLAWQPRCEAPWGLIDVFLAVVLLFAATAFALSIQSSVIGKVAVDEMSSRQRAMEILLQSAASLATMFVSLAVIVARHRATLSDFGIVLRKVWGDVRLGVVAFLLLAPLVYTLQFLLVQYLEFESKHPLIVLLKKDPSTELVVAAIVSAVLVAPIFEEYLFRVILQGWLEKFADQPEDLAGIWLGSGGRGTKAIPPSGTRATWPVFASSLVFALLHFSHGPDWIPLFFLAIGLGYIYRQTHRVLPCIVVHFLLNGVSIGMFLIQVYGEPV